MRPFQVQDYLSTPGPICQDNLYIFERKVIFLTSRELVEIIEAELSKKKIPKGEFYTACGISSGHMSNWRRGLNYPQTPTLIKMSDYLGIDLMGKKTPATENGDGRYGLTRAEWEQIGRIFYNKVYAIGKAPGWLASEQTGLSVGDVEDFLAGKRYVTKAQIHAMADRLGMSLWDVIGSYAQAFDGEEDEVIADRERLLQVAERLSPELLREAVRFLDIPAEDQESAAHDLALVNQVRRTRS